MPYGLIAMKLKRSECDRMIPWVDIKEEQYLDVFLPGFFISLNVFPVAVRISDKILRI